MEGQGEEHAILAGIFYIPARGRPNQHRLPGKTVSARALKVAGVFPRFLPPGENEAPAHRHHLAAYDFPILRGSADAATEQPTQVHSCTK
jgi:hypothetical protein